MLQEIVLLQCWQIQLDQCLLEKDFLVLAGHLLTQSAACPLCGLSSVRVHSRYTRHLADLPISGQSVQIQLLVRRFFCLNSKCERRTFVEQLPALMAKRARRTLRQYQLLQNQAFALGGEPGGSAAAKIGIKISGDTLLRIIHKTPLPQRPTPRVLGVDDWAKRKGVEYGTILVDLEAHCPVDLLVDCKAETLAKWLEAHPGVEVISRDRASAYADGARRGAPEAIQVADRWHLLKNLGDHLKAMVERKSASLLAPQTSPLSQEMAGVSEGSLKENEAEPLPPQTAQTQTRLELEQAEVQFPAPTPMAQIGELNPEKKAVLAAEVPTNESESGLSRKSYLFEQIKTLAQEGLALRVVARELGVSRQTVRKYARAEKVPNYSPRRAKPSKLDLYKPYLATRWQEGVCKRIDLFLEIKERGYDGSWALLGQHLAKYRLENPSPKPQKIGRGRPPGWSKAAQHARSGPAKTRPRPLLSAREASFLLMKAGAKLSEKEQQQLSHLRAFDGEVEAAYQLSQQFVKMVKERQGQKLEEWLRAVGQKEAEAQLMELGSFRRGIVQDQAAVKMGLTLEVSQGQTEGQVNRLKTLKRMMYGRASFELLRARVLHSEAA